MSENTPIVEIKELCYSAGGQDILHDINLSICEGDFVSIIGPNGGGKTTLLKLILGLLKPGRGSITINNRRPRTHDTTIGYVPQHVNHNLSFPATALDVVLMGYYNPRKRFQKFDRAQKRQEAMEIMERLGIGAFANRKIVALSGGQRQRVLIARALIAQPELLVLDEPTASIDTKGQTEFYEMLKELNKDLTILMVSHDLLIIASYVKSIICLNRTMYYHQSFSSSGEVLDAFHSCTVDEICPVDIVRQGKLDPSLGEGTK